MDDLAVEKFQSLNAIQNRDILDLSGNHVGVIHDLLFDARDGRIEYVCIALASTGDYKQREAIVPWSALRLHRGRACWQVAAGKRILKSIAQPVAHRSQGFERE